MGRRYWSCAKETAKERCSTFQWASPSAKAKEADWFPTGGDDDGPTSVLLLTLRRGMHGRCVLLSATELAEYGEPTGTHLGFVRKDGAMLAFVDARVRVRSDAIWNYGLWGGAYRRGPDPLYEYAAFRARALALLHADLPPLPPPPADGQQSTQEQPSAQLSTGASAADATRERAAATRPAESAEPAESALAKAAAGERAQTETATAAQATTPTPPRLPPPVRDAAALLDAPACELLLDQRICNGVGNYLRAEIMYRAGVKPFESARAALLRARANGETPPRGEPDGRPSQQRHSATAPLDLLSATRACLQQAVRDKGRDWLNVYCKRYARRETDGLGRAVWYRGERGPLPPTLYEADGAWDSLFIARIPDKVTKAILHALCATFGVVEHVTHNARRGFAFVRFADVPSATAALQALGTVTLFGSRMAVRYKRRLRKVRPSVAGSLIAADNAPPHSSTFGAEGGGMALGSEDVEADAQDEEELLVIDEEMIDDEGVEPLEVEPATSSQLPPAPAQAAPLLPLTQAVALAQAAPVASVGEALPHGSSSMSLQAASTKAEEGEERDEEEDEDEWDEPCFEVVDHSADASQGMVPVPAESDAFAKSLRSFRAAGALAAPAFAPVTHAHGAYGIANSHGAVEPVYGGVRGASGETELQALARSYHALAQDELNRLHAPM